ncbi:MAG: hypothetical protein IKN52_08515, partial [Victivallales bacterium]|nr:hypothetical protein [Victivallales bacterium]
CGRMVLTARTPPPHPRDGGAPPPHPRDGGTSSLHFNGETLSLPLPPFQHAMALNVGDEGVVFGEPVD